MTKKTTNYSVEMHFPESYKTSFDNYRLFSKKLVATDPRISEEPKKLYIGFKVGKKVAVAVRVQQQKLVLELYRVEPSNLDDPKNKVSYKANSFEDFNKHVSIFSIRTADDVEYAINLSEQVLDKFFTNDHH